MTLELPERKPTRLPDYDYSTPGGYFVTVCCQNRNRFFDFPPAKAMVENVWRDIPKKFINAEIDVFVVMPDHFHGILILKPNITYPVGEALVASRERRTDSSENEDYVSREHGTDSNENRNSVGEALVASRMAVNENFADVGKREGTSPSPTGNRKIAGLTEIIGAFKSTTTWKYSLGVNNEGWPKYYKKIWQRSFFDHVIRNDEDLTTIKHYIVNNPSLLAMGDQS